MFRGPSQAALFDDEREERVLSASGADIRFIPSFLTITDAERLFDALHSLDGWHQDHIRLYGKRHPLPRLHRWFAESRQPYHWSGIEMQPEPFPEALRPVLERIKRESRVEFNTALGNLYRGGQDSVSWHADDEPELGENPVIASLSLGATRRFLLRRKDDHAQSLSFDLTHGSLLWMSGATQAVWEHSIPKTKRIVGARINVTFRAMV